MSLDESRFLTLADDTLRRLADAIDDAIGAEYDVDFEAGILTIAAGHGQYVVNKHAPNRQIWLSSPRSGAWHFDWDPATERWRSTRDATVELTGLLGGELGVPL